MGYLTSKTSKSPAIEAKCANVAHLLSEPRKKEPRIEARNHDFFPSSESSPYYEFNTHQMNLSDLSLQPEGPITDLNDSKLMLAAE